ncbi:hypothetical protein [Nocardioides bruguierae]|uniref:Uncharacterized protein n=1 Tax=Nocardioides bruguierae TaxID=2945102 RepID=A0A9X2IE15_9ACTN|nr:hypothetical protein [Nocardioides bruguierae]MCM0619807.1 hypothetical protein [Nocardioides bruguierae]
MAITTDAEAHAALVIVDTLTREASHDAETVRGAVRAIDDAASTQLGAPVHRDVYALDAAIVAAQQAASR